MEQKQPNRNLCCSCSRILNRVVRFCPYCGKKQPIEASAYCFNCGAVVTAGQKYCYQCGKSTKLKSSRVLFPAVAITLIFVIALYSYGGYLFYKANDPLKTISQYKAELIAICPVLAESGELLIKIGDEITNRWYDYIKGKTYYNNKTIYSDKSLIQEIYLVYNTDMEQLNRNNEKIKAYMISELQQYATNYPSKQLKEMRWIMGGITMSYIKLYLCITEIEDNYTTYAENYNNRKTDFNNAFNELTDLLGTNITA